MQQLRGTKILPIKCNFYLKINKEEMMCLRLVLEYFLDKS